MLQSFLEGVTKYTNKYGDEIWSIDGKKCYPETAPPGDSSHIQSPNSEPIVDAKKGMLTGA